MSYIVETTLIRDNAKLPVYMTAGAAGADVALPIVARIEPHQTVKVPLGISLDIPAGMYVEMVPRSSLLVKYGLLSPTSIIDSDYTGEIHAVLYNTTSKPIKLDFGTRVVQLLLHERNKVTSWCNKNIQRDQSGFGGTGDV